MSSLSFDTIYCVVYFFLLSIIKPEMRRKSTKKTQKINFFITLSKTSIFYLFFLDFFSSNLLTFRQIFGAKLVNFWRLPLIMRCFLTYSMMQEAIRWILANRGESGFCFSFHPFIQKTNKKLLTFYLKAHRMFLLSGCSTMVVQQLPKLNTRVRFPSSAPIFKPSHW